jgi:hypothetical protein
VFAPELGALHASSPGATTVSVAAKVDVIAAPAAVLMRLPDAECLLIGHRPQAMMLMVAPPRRRFGNHLLAQCDDLETPGAGT